MEWSRLKLINGAFISYLLNTLGKKYSSWHFIIHNSGFSWKHSLLCRADEFYFPYSLPCRLACFPTSVLMFIAVHWLKTVRCSLCWVCCAQSCPALCSPMDCSPPGSSLHAILQARILEHVAIPFSRGSSRPRDDWTGVSCTGKWILYHLSHRGSPYICCCCCCC